MTKPILIDVPMPILTPRLELRPRYVGEGKILIQAVRESLQNLEPWMPFAHKDVREEQMEEHCRTALANFITRQDFTLSIYERSSGRFVGSTGLHRPNWAVRSFHVGYWVHREFEGRGIVSEAVNAITRYAFEVFKANRLEIRCDSRNERSFNVMKRLGFVQEGLLKNDDVAKDGSLRDTIVTARYDAGGLPELEVAWGHSRSLGSRTQN